MTSSLTLGALITVFSVTCNGYWPPEQIHINMGLTPDQMVFNWLTWNMTSSIVRLGTVSSHPNDLTMNISGSASVFTDCGDEHTNRTIHVANISNLSPTTLYYYQVGDVENGFSDVYSFTTPPDASTLESTLPHTFIYFGDMGTTNTQACAAMTQEVLNGDVNAVIHIGDFAYNMFEQNGTTGDEFMRDIEPLAANVPYMVAMGNHEAAYNFSHYTQRFRGQPLPLSPPGDSTVWTESGELPNNWYYSFNYGLVHFICISSEIYFNFPYLVSTQYEWLVNDLKIANENRTNAPWVVVYHHRPLYCDATGSECEDQAFVMRNGLNSSQPSGDSVEYKYGLEDVYFEYGVDIVLSGHVHAYERTFDIYKNVTQQRTENMTATMYVINGDAGNREGHHLFNNASDPWSAYRTNAYGYGKMKVYNATHLKLEQIVSDTELPQSEQGKKVDDVWIVQYQHGPFNNTQRDEKVGWKETVTYNPWAKYGIDVKVVDEDHGLEQRIQYISDNKMDYKGVHGVHF